MEGNTAESGGSVHKGGLHLRRSQEQGRPFLPRRRQESPGPRWRHPADPSRLVCGPGRMCSAWRSRAGRAAGRCARFAFPRGAGCGLAREGGAQSALQAPGGPLTSSSCLSGIGYGSYESLVGASGLRRGRGEGVACPVDMGHWGGVIPLLWARIAEPTLWLPDTETHEPPGTAT